LSTVIGVPREHPTKADPTAKRTSIQLIAARRRQPALAERFTKGLGAQQVDDFLDAPHTIRDAR
jgi:hypothetical protein